MDKPTDFDTLIAVLQNLMGQISTFKGAYEFVNNENEELKARIESLESENTALKSEIAELRGYENAVE